MLREALPNLSGGDPKSSSPRQCEQTHPDALLLFLTPLIYSESDSRLIYSESGSSHPETDGCFNGRSIPNSLRLNGWSSGPEPRQTERLD